MELTPERIATILHKHLKPAEATAVIKVFNERAGVVAALMQMGPNKFKNEADIAKWAKQIAHRAKNTGDG